MHFDHTSVSGDRPGLKRSVPGNQIFGHFSQEKSNFEVFWASARASQSKGTLDLWALFFLS
jgi:hypothetical protein